jgi:hypothetical protein
LAIIRAEVGREIAVVELGPRLRKQEKPAIWGKVEGTAGKNLAPISGTIGVVTDAPLVRVVAASGGDLTLKAAGRTGEKYRYELAGEFLGDVALVWRDGVFAPWEPTDDYLVPIPEPVPAEGLAFFTILQPYDQRWTSPLGGPANPRPGTVYQVRAKVVREGEKKSRLALFLTHKSSKSMGLFQDTFQAKLDGPGPHEAVFAGIRKPSMQRIALRDLSLRMFPTGGEGGRIEEIAPVRFVRPRLGVSSVKAVDLGTVRLGEAAVSEKRHVLNAQEETVKAVGKEFATILYGVANISVPDDKRRAHMQTIDHTGVVLVGKDAGLFSLVGEHRTEAGGIALVGSDGEPGLRGGAEPEKETFAVKFKGAREAGTYTCAVRFVTQAGNAGVCSTGKADEPMEGLYYLDIPVTVTAE